MGVRSWKGGSLKYRRREFIVKIVRASIWSPEGVKLQQGQYHEMDPFGHHTFQMMPLMENILNYHGICDKLVIYHFDMVAEWDHLMVSWFHHLSPAFSPSRPQIVTHSTSNSHPFTHWILTILPSHSSWSHLITAQLSTTHPLCINIYICLGKKQVFEIERVRIDVRNSDF